MTEVKRSVDENGVVHFTQENAPTVHVKIENKTEQSKDELWTDLKLSIVEKYKDLGVEFDADTIQNKADLDNAGRILVELEKKDKEKLDAESNKLLDLHGQNETAMLNYNQIHGTTYQLDKDSDLPISMMTAETPEELVAICENNAKMGDKERQRILSQLTSKMIKPNKLDMQYEGNIKDFMRSPKIINEFDSEEVKRQKENFNNKLKNNRVNWTNINDY